MKTSSPVDDPLVDLMLRYQAGEEEAFRSLVAQIEPLLIRFFEQKCGDRWLAEDLSQSVLMKIYRAREAYWPKSKFTSWLYCIAGNVYKNHLRYSSKRNVLPPDGYECDQPITVPDSLEAEDRISVFHSVLASCHPSWRRVCNLRLAGASYQEIAERMGTSLAAVKSMLNRMRNQLRWRLVETAPEDFPASQLNGVSCSA